MADKYIEATVVVRYPLGSPESYGGETDWAQQMLLEQQYLNEEGDYLLAVIGSDFARTTIKDVRRSVT